MRGGTKACIGFERCFRARHVEAVDPLQAVSVWHPEHAEQRVGAHTVEANADDLAANLLWNQVRRPEEVGLVLEDLVDSAAVDVELVRADLLDAAGDLGVEQSRGRWRRTSILAVLEKRR